ncbi:Protein-glutamate methylesterase/protein-glutamine glutaminase [Dyadobacter sp. CECT 9275]|uniref:protein-glutamate methylesterase n=1 Tax=Dyadobacter helix TaxID=2822344 RepID=A0A916N7G1_9BACT|nr:chemotaxis protein CheB [Dyadobacter sp. CECT 9275]CAG5016642.1 Protein-glutamate methylesterase/protein-glutamine glutaminase [Dyadobacter sp. CECT 9275]
MEENSMITPKCEAVVIGGSAGSLAVLFEILPKLKQDHDFALIIVLHRKYNAESSLSELLGSKTLNTLTEIEDKDPIIPGNIYLAPADYHVLIENNRIFSLDHSEKVNFSRPSLDVTFESAAQVYGRSLIGVLLSGANDDGTKGLHAVKHYGGMTIVQDPQSAQMPMMPQYAIDHENIDKILDVANLIIFLNTL